MNLGTQARSESLYLLIYPVYIIIINFMKQSVSSAVELIASHFTHWSIYPVHIIIINELHEAESFLSCWANSESLYSLIDLPSPYYHY
jgi:hypothetical protein